MSFLGQMSSFIPWSYLMEFYVHTKLCYWGEATAQAVTKLYIIHVVVSGLREFLSCNNLIENNAALTLFNPELPTIVTDASDLAEFLPSCMQVTKKGQ